MEHWFTWVERIRPTRQPPGFTLLEFTPSSRVERIRPSPSTSAAAVLRDLKHAGRDVIDLTIGEPDFDTADNVKRAAIDAINAGSTKYTPVNGILPLRQAIAEKYRQAGGGDYSPDDITVGGGAKQVIFLALMASVDAGDEVVVPAPYWVSYPDMVMANAATPVVVSTSEQDNFKITPRQLNDAITPRTRWLILNNPGNPTGSLYHKDELKRIAEVLLEHPHVWILCDDIYSDIVYSDQPASSLTSVEPRLAERTLAINGVSKTYAMTGWRIGWGAGPRQLVDAINTLQSQISSCPSSISQAAALEAIRGNQDYLQGRIDQFRHRRNEAAARLNKISDLHCSLPEGAFYLFPSCQGVIGKTTPGGEVIATDYDFSRYLLRQVGVGVIHGSAYGCSPHFRLSFAVPDDVLIEGCGRISDAVRELSAS